MEINTEDQELRKWIVEKVLNYHAVNNADTKRIRTDCEALYEFIKKWIK